MKHNTLIFSELELVVYISRRKLGICKIDPRLEQAYAERAVTKPAEYPGKFYECLRNAMPWYKTLDRDTKLHVKCLLSAAGVDLKTFEKLIHYQEHYSELVYNICHNVIPKNQ